MRLYIVGISTIRKLVIPSDYKGLYNFAWTTAGRKHALFLTETPEELRKTLEERTGFKATVSEAPRDVNEFFELLRKFIELDYRVINSVIEVSVSPFYIGKFIGSKGKNIRAVKKHLNKDVRVLMPYLVKRMFYYRPLDEFEVYEVAVKKKQFGAQELQKVRLIRKLNGEEGWKIANKCFKCSVWKEWGFSFRDGYLAPWHL